MIIIIIPNECFKIFQPPPSSPTYGSTFSLPADKLPDIMPVDDQLLIIGQSDLIKPSMMMMMMTPSPIPTLSPLAQLFIPQALMLQMDTMNVEHRDMDNIDPISLTMDQSSSQQQEQQAQQQQTLPTTLSVQEIEQNLIENDTKILAMNKELEKFPIKFQGFIAEMKIKWKILKLMTNKLSQYKRRTKRQSINDVGGIFNNIFRQARTTATNGMTKMQRTIQENTRRLFGNVFSNNSRNNSLNKIGESMGLSQLWSRIMNIYDLNNNTNNSRNSRLKNI
ncbi:hypothetical protein HUG17_9164 [Dermatophagoides farinae]|uniref:Uncharacterized protein n=1 Tax=Dermatophagoides farinae TaxID=6954 RepID=A0A9D4NTN8_DERFA|nr:hypothetical protein HUG17_9164 [Dermatophagoides farinae]